MIISKELHITKEKNSKERFIYNASKPSFEIIYHNHLSNLFAKDVQLIKVN